MEQIVGIKSLVSLLHQLLNVMRGMRNKAHQIIIEK